MFKSTTWLIFGGLWSVTVFVSGYRGDEPLLTLVLVLATLLHVGVGAILQKLEEMGVNDE